MNVAWKHSCYWNRSCMELVVFDKGNVVWMWVAVSLGVLLLGDYTTCFMPYASVDFMSPPWTCRCNLNVSVHVFELVP